jgi:hypothetical protein
MDAWRISVGVSVQSLSKFWYGAVQSSDCRLSACMGRLFKHYRIVEVVDWLELQPLSIQNKKTLCANRWTNACGEE